MSTEQQKEKARALREFGTELKRLGRELRRVAPGALDEGNILVIRRGLHDLRAVVDAIDNALAS